MSAWLLIGALAALYLAFSLGLALWLGRVLAGASIELPNAAGARCSCRRYAYPSPLCEIHGREAA